MKRVLAATALCAAIVPASAAALFGVEFNGNVSHQPSSLVGFNVGPAAAGGKQAFDFTTQNIAYTCDDSSTGHTSPLQFTKAFPIENRVFDGKARKVTGETDPKLRVHGELLPGKKARGTLRLTGQLNDAAPSATCDTGKVHWRAAKLPFRS